MKISTTYFKMALMVLITVSGSTLFGQTAIVGPADQYAFQYDNGGGATPLGLYFSATSSRYEFRDLAGIWEFYVNPINKYSAFQNRLAIGKTTPSSALDVAGETRLGNSTAGDYAKIQSNGDLVFQGGADYLVPNNRYAFRAQSDQDIGLYFSQTNFRYEFRDAAASPVFFIHASTGDLNATGGLKIGSTGSALAGTLRWNGTDFQGYNGTGWQSLTASGTGGTDDQTLSLSGNNLSIEDGNTVNLGTIDNQTLSLSGTNLTIDGGNTVNISSVNTDNQTISLSGTNLSIAGGNTVDLSGLGGGGTDADWTISGSNQYSAVSGNVGIGTSAPTSKLEVVGNAEVRSGSMILNNPGIFGSEDDGRLESNGGFDFHLDENNNGLEIVEFYDGANQPLFSIAEGGISRARNEMIVDNKLIVGDIGPISEMVRVDGNPDSTGNIIHAQTNYTGFVDIRGVRSVSVTNPGYGIGVEGQGGWRGVWGYNPATTYTGFSYGVYGESSGSGSIGTRIGLYGTAYGGATNWAGYFSSGNVYITNDLRIGNTTGAAGYKVSVDGKIMCEELAVQNSTVWPDYVFKKDYSLTSLEDLELKIAELGHLPGVPSAEEVAQDGAKVGEMQAVLLEKVEELTLYIIDLQKQIRVLENK